MRREEFMRPYLVVHIIGEEFPLLIKMKSSRDWTNNSDLLIYSNPSRLFIRLHTGFATTDDMRPIDGIKFEVFDHSVDCTMDIHIRHDVVQAIEMKWFDEGCLYIDAARQYYKDNYGILYER